MSDVNPGFVPASAAKMPSIADALAEYLERVARIPGVGPVNASSLRAYHVPPRDFVRNNQQIQEALAQLVMDASGGE